MRSRILLGLSKANRQVAGVVTGDEVEVEVELDAERQIVVEPADLARALDTDPVARAAYDRLTISQKRQHVRVIENAKKLETRARWIEKPWLYCGTRTGTTSVRNREAPEPSRT
jgi:uncharacterized protein YdeI (YjbR/CyaY-like superfamily)